MSSGLINTALDIGQAAGDLSGVPYLSSAFTLVKSIKDNCDRVQAHKVDNPHCLIAIR
ncbi:hypothetical protein EUX98_g2417 [Antrodiella citrinella]|uniref:Uncharacterized protein n=1 Tax=Antrodiella citrinella TaxID=2447956 RepID=A0A4S4MZ10_9APHY|nr:hypothetical protein EUX98_g2417 [Antrodiella citrinella]